MNNDPNPSSFELIFVLGKLCQRKFKLTSLDMKINQEMSEIPINNLLSSNDLSLTFQVMHSRNYLLYA